MSISEERQPAQPTHPASQPTTQPTPEAQVSQPSSTHDMHMTNIEDAERIAGPEPSWLTPGDVDRAAASRDRTTSKSQPQAFGGQEMFQEMELFWLRPPGPPPKLSEAMREVWEKKVKRGDHLLAPPAAHGHFFLYSYCFISVLCSFWSQLGLRPLGFFLLWGSLPPLLSHHCPNTVAPLVCVSPSMCAAYWGNAGIVMPFKINCQLVSKAPDVNQLHFRLVKWATLLRYQVDQMSLLRFPIWALLLSPQLLQHWSLLQDLSLSPRSTSLSLKEGVFP